MNKRLSVLILCAVAATTACNSSQTEEVESKAKIAESNVANLDVAKSDVNDSVIVKLAAAQLDAYNRADLDEFCACYHDDVRVIQGESEDLRGIDAFRERYAAMFAKGGFGASVPKRVALGDHCVDLEHWWRESGKSGKVIVRYTERDGLIGVVQFLR